tara:strand:- start:255 stop:497 length:243 start_codon:yes stop_codon:yes gene_type:complete
MTEVQEVKILVATRYGNALDEIITRLTEYSNQCEGIQDLHILEWETHDIVKINNKDTDIMMRKNATWKSRIKLANWEIDK